MIITFHPLLLCQPEILYWLHRATKQLKCGKLHLGKCFRVDNTLSQLRRLILHFHCRYCVKSYTGHREWVRMVRVHPDGQLFASCSNDHSIRVWNINTKECKVSQSHTLITAKNNWAHESLRFKISTIRFTSTCIARLSFEITITLLNVLLGQMKMLRRQ